MMFALSIVIWILCDINVVTIRRYVSKNRNVIAEEKREEAFHTRGLSYRRFTRYNNRSDLFLPDCVKL